MVEQKVIALSRTPTANEFLEAVDSPVARGFIPDRLRSSRSPVDTVSLKDRAGRFWGRCAPQRGQVPSPQEIVAPPWIGSEPRSRAPQTNKFANNGAARKGRRFVLCLPLETL